MKLQNDLGEIRISSEVFTAIQQKTIDGQENGCSVTKSAKMDEIQKYMTI